MQHLQPLADAPAAHELLDELGNTSCATQVGTVLGNICGQSVVNQLSRSCRVW